MADTMLVSKQNTMHYLLRFRDADLEPLPITGCIIYFTVKDMESDPLVSDENALIHIIITADDHTDPGGGFSEMTLTPDDLNVDEGFYFFDFQLENASGEVTTLQKGIIQITNRVTTTLPT